MKRVAAVCAALCCLGSGASAFALTIVPTSDPTVLTNAVLGSDGAISVISSSYSGAAVASATYSEGPLGISDGVLLTSGEASLALPPDGGYVTKDNGQPGDPLCNALVSGIQSFDAVKLTIQFSLAPGFNGISLQFVFGSDEYPVFVGSPKFNDVFGVYLDGTQVAFDAGGNPITINGPFFSGGSVVVSPATETEYGGSTNRLTTKAPSLPGVHTLQVVICDGGDYALDSGVFMAGLTGCVGGGCTGTASCADVDSDADGASSCVDCNDADPTMQTGTPELCDGLDNNCDGAVDEGNPGSGLACSSGLPGLCDAGMTNCAGGATVCTALVMPGSTAEVCDGLDNNCDGVVDDGNPGSGLACSSGLPGLCDAGMTNCAGGATVCTALVMPGSTAEVCDGLDNNCDGAADEGNPGSGLACSSGLPGLCDAGTASCAGGAPVCTALVMPGTTAEVCDGLDNDCDGTVDEDNPGGGLACSSGLPGLCDEGTTSCAGGAIVCTANTAPGSKPEICDNKIDEDCNGTADDGPSCGAGGGGGGGSGGGSSSSSGSNDVGSYVSGGGLVCSMKSGKSEGSGSAWALALAAGAMAYRRRRAAS